MGVMSLERLTPLFILLASAASLLTALTAEYGFGVDPCILCTYQRIPFAVTAVLALIALRLDASSPLLVPIIIICGLAYLGGAGVAVYHVGVEQHWWVSGCTGTLAENVSLDQLKASLMQKPEKPCDQLDWTLFGISMATYNVVYSGVLGLASLAAGLKIRKANHDR